MPGFTFDLETARVRIAAVVISKGIPIVPATEPKQRSGDEYRTPRGHRDQGRDQGGRERRPAPAGRKPPWLRAPMPAGERFDEVRQRSRAPARDGLRGSEVPEHRRVLECRHGDADADGLGVHARLPVLRGRHRQSARLARRREPANSARTSSSWASGTSCSPRSTATTCRTAARTFRGLRARDQAANARTAVEALTPDFQGVLATSRRWSTAARSVRAERRDGRAPHVSRARSARGLRPDARVLAHAKRHRPSVLTKTSLMLGLGETDDEIVATMDDLRGVGVDLLTLGQYLRPTANHLPVERYVTPDEFERFAVGARAASSSASRAAGALELPRRAGARRQQRRSRQRRRWVARPVVAVSALSRRRRSCAGSVAPSTSRPGARCSGTSTRAVRRRATRSGSWSTRRCSRWG